MAVYSHWFGPTLFSCTSIKMRLAMHLFAEHCSNDKREKHDVARKSNRANYFNINFILFFCLWALFFQVIHATRFVCLTKKKWRNARKRCMFVSTVVRRAVWRHENKHMDMKRFIALLLSENLPLWDRPYFIGFWYWRYLLDNIHAHTIHTQMVCMLCLPGIISLVVRTLHIRL